MRQIAATLCVSSVLLAAGCNLFNNRNPGAASDVVAKADAPPPAVKDLVDYLNDCSNRMQSVKSDGLYMDCKAPNGSVGLIANMVCEKPRNFRLRGTLAGQTACDIGSNNDEFWYWIKQSDPPFLYHCSYDAMSRGNVRLPFPFQPDMVIAALGMAQYDPDPSKYDLKVVKDKLELSENVTTAQGQPARRVTVFARGKVDVSKGRPQVVEYALRDLQGHELCKATVQRVTIQGGAIVPQQVRVSWPEQKMELALTLNTVSVNAVRPEFARAVFNRSDLPYRTYDLARSAQDGSSTSIQRVRGAMR
jgi:hypothetical protein